MTEPCRSDAGECGDVGVDVHKETSTVTGVCHKQIVKTATVPAEPASLAASVRRWLPGAPRASAYEAGFSACVRHRALTQAGISHIVVHPASLAVAAHDKVKTDRRDSTRLAVDLADGRLRGSDVPTEEEELARLLPRTRAQLGEHRATRARQIKAKLHPFGLIAPSSRRLRSHRYVRESEAWTLPPALRASLQMLAEPGRFVTRQLLEMRRLLREQATAQAAIDPGYRSVPGIGEVVARTLATALGDMTRFANERALFSYTGLTPSAYSSGAAVRRGPMSRQGSSRSGTCSSKQPGVPSPTTRCSKRCVRGLPQRAARNAPSWPLPDGSSGGFVRVFARAPCMRWGRWPKSQGTPGRGLGWKGAIPWWLGLTLSSFRPS